MLQLLVYSIGKNIHRKLQQHLISFKTCTFTNNYYKTAGIGRGIAVELWRAGANIVALSRTRSHLETLQSEYPSIDIVDVDIADWEKTRKVVESLGHFDALVNNAAVAICEPFLDCSSSDFDKYAFKSHFPNAYMITHIQNNIDAKHTQITLKHFFIFRMFNVNVKATLNISQIVARKMVENKTPGAIVNISSQASKVKQCFNSTIPNITVLLSSAIN